MTPAFDLNHCLRRAEIGAIGLLFLALLTYCYGPVFSAMVHQWWSNDMYSYGFIIPVISLYLVWLHREKLRTLRPTPRYGWGIGTLFVGLSMLVIGHAGAVLFVQEISLIVTLTGMVMFILGLQFTKVLLFPISYLLFMIPVWDILTDRLHAPFQFFSARFGAMAMQFLDIPAYHQGVYIELPNITLEVAKVCSGVNYLIAVVAVGIVLGYLFLEQWSKRVILLCLGILIAALANGFRVALIGTLSYYGLSQDLHGPYHVLQALSVSMVGYGALFVGVSILSKRSITKKLSGQPKEPVQPRGGVYQENSKILVAAVGLSLTLLLIGTYVNFYRPSPIPLTTSLTHFPLQIGGWKGVDTLSIYSEFKGLGTDQDLSRKYYPPKGEEIYLNIGYFASQHQGKELFHEKTTHLFKMASNTVVPLSDSTLIKVNRLIMKDGHRNLLVLFWCDLNGRIVTDPYRGKIITAWDTLINGRTNGAVIMIAAELPEGVDPSEVLSHAQTFTREIYPLVRNYLPHF